MTELTTTTTTNKQTKLPEYTTQDLKRSVLGIGISSFAECDWLKEQLAFRAGGTFPDLILCIRIHLL